MSRHVERLAAAEGNAVRAPAIISSLHAIVEELVLNSIDAGARSIKVRVNTREGQWGIDCLDDGKGLGLEDLERAAQWHWTSKSGGSAFFGFRGEALAAISSLCDLEITSKKIGSCAHRRIVTPKQSAALQPDTICGDSGTLVVVRNIFAHLPVRRGCLVLRDELKRANEFMSKTAVLHHWLRLSLEVAPPMETESIGRTLLDWAAVPAPSVSHRFRAQHGEEALSRMLNVSVRSGCVTVEGLLAPPLPGCLESHIGCQYLFVNARWSRGNDWLSQQLNKWYRETTTSMVTGRRGGGPSRGHFDLDGAADSAQFATHPAFVLELRCPHRQCEVFSEPDKSVTRFSDEVMRGIEGCLGILKATMTAVVEQEKARASILDDGAPPTLQLFAVNPTYTRALTTSPTSASFRAAFVPTPRSSVKKTAKQDKEVVVSTSSTTTIDALDASTTLLWAEPLCLLSAYDDFEEGSDDCDEPAKSGMKICPELAVKVYRPKPAPPLNTEPQQISMASIAAPMDQNFYHSASFQFPSQQLPDLNLPPPEIDQHKSESYPKISMQTFAFPGPVVQQLTLDRSALAPGASRVIGQCDNKFVLLMTFTGTLLCGDQHAMDERQRLETLQRHQQTFPNTCGVQVVEEVMDLTGEQLAVLDERSAELESLGFRWHQLTLVQVPVVLSSALTAQDFGEFLVLLATEPTSASRSARIRQGPPAKTRLLQFRACHSAVKFGDKLSRETCRQLVAKLQQCQLPFQCAHGRPSVVPLVSLLAPLNDISHNVQPAPPAKRPRYSQLPNC